MLFVQEAIAMGLPAMAIALALTGRDHHRLARRRQAGVAVARLEGACIADQPPFSRADPATTP